MAHVIEDFYGVYLLYNINPSFKGRIYIGYTVDPNRRIQQHNTGIQAGGARKTSGRGPWEMVLTIHGFPNNISALRFEWAWQNPNASRRLKHLPKKKRTESAYQYHFRIVCEMLRTGPWHRLPLTIRWLKQEYQQEFPPNLLPPMHMPIVYGPVRRKKVKPSQSQLPAFELSPQRNQQLLHSAMDPENNANSLSCINGFSQPRMTKKWLCCAVCLEKLVDPNSVLRCIHVQCRAVSHITCLAGQFLAQRKTNDAELQLIPVDGCCPSCGKEVLWGDLIRLRNGCYQNLIEGELNEEDKEHDSDEDHWANVLSQNC